MPEPIKTQEKPSPTASPKPSASVSTQTAVPQQTTTSKKKERVETPIYKFYEVKGERVARLRRECPRCGKGTFLAEHRDRLTCGKCGYTSYKKTQQK